jgi:CelD/BcsL family acetyltransferase involved in cellulose biosynthesis
MWYDATTPTVEALEASDRQAWLDMNANRINRDMEYEEWCAVRGLDPEDANTAFLFELDTVETAGPVRASFWREHGYAS